MTGKYVRLWISSIIQEALAAPRLQEVVGIDVCLRYVASIQRSADIVDDSCSLARTVKKDRRRGRNSYSTVLYSCSIEVIIILTTFSRQASRQSLTFPCVVRNFCVARASSAQCTLGLQLNVDYSRLFAIQDFAKRLSTNMTNLCVSEVFPQTM